MYNELIKELIIKLLDRLKNGEDTVDSHFFRLNKIRKSLDYNDEIKALILKKKSITKRINRLYVFG